MGKKAEEAQSEPKTTIEQKKETTKLFEKTKKQLGSKLKANMDMKQLLKAIRELTKYAARVKLEKEQTSLLVEEDDYFTVTFTLT